VPPTRSGGSVSVADGDLRMKIAETVSRLLSGYCKKKDRPNYATGADARGNKWIRCLRCGLTSYNINDVLYRYCGHCCKFHDDIENIYDIYT
jgi:hypothetical protein